MSIFGRKTAKQDAFPYGTPAYDATIHPANAAALATVGDRLQQMRDIHLFGGKGAAAEAYSHYRDSTPSPTIVAMMGLAQQRDLILTAVDRKHDQPYPGVSLGATPSFSNAPNTAPLAGHALARGHHSHRVEHEQTTRRRFGG